jgi:hypothetical protein
MSGERGVRGDAGWRRYIRVIYPGISFDDPIGAKLRRGRVSASDFQRDIIIRKRMGDLRHVWSRRWSSATFCDVSWRTFNIAEFVLNKEGGEW